VQWRDPATGESKSDLFQRAVREEHKLREEHESNRLFYVAMTRAEEHLVLSFSTCGKKAENWARTVQEALELDLEPPSNEPSYDTFRGVRLRRLRPDAPPPRAASLRDMESREPAETLHPAARPAQYDSNVTVTSINQFANCPRRYYLSRYLGWEGGRSQPLSMDVEIDDEADLPAEVFGRQVHALLAGQRVEAADPAAVALARSFENSGLARRVARAAVVEREFDFILAWEDMVLRGQIDLWFEEGGELVIVDYKTDQIKAPEAESRAREYELQLRLYAQALQQLTGRAPKAAYVHFLRVNRSVPVELAPTLFDDPLQIVREFRQAQDTLNFPLHVAEHCPKCPFYRSLCPAEEPPADGRGPESSLAD
jgi:ATP-dependent exoDNAse (exonuclease V) beta subunit